jgi:hypothetical protein
MNRQHIGSFFAILLITSTAFAQPPDSITVKWSGFVDTYFMYDFNNLPNNMASHPFTQPRRHNEFNINLAHIEVDLNSPNIRGVLALHGGTAVQGNYAAEASVYQLAPLIHQAWAGYRVANNLWVDAGVYPAPYGFESWMSKDNKTYTRSIVADYSPYYQTGIRATWTPSEVFTAGINIINGWQNMAETNTDKAVGLTIGYTPSSTISFTYNNFIGNEMPAGTSAALRIYHNLCTRLSVNNDLQFDLTTDYGTQKKDNVDASWLGFALIGKYQFTPVVSATLRGEYYKDEHQIILVTGSTDGFDGLGVSANIDFQCSSQLVWRTEVRMLKNKTKIFNSEDGSTDRSSFIVSSLALSL